MHKIQFSRLQKYLLFPTNNPEKAGPKFLNALFADTFSRSKTTEKLTKDYLGIYEYNSLDHLSKLLHNGSKDAFKKYEQLFRETFADILDNGVQFKGRIKSDNSIFNKFNIDGRVSLKKTASLATAVPDLLGFKLVTNEEKEINAAIDKIEQLVKEGKLSSVRVINNGTQPYLNKNHLERLSKQGFKTNTKCNDRINTSNIYFKDKTGRMIELQLTGKETEIVSSKEHPIYKFLRYGSALGDDGYTIQDLQEKLWNFTPEQFKGYKKYICDCYTYARNLELKTPSQKPTLPENIDKALELV